MSGAAVFRKKLSVKQIIFWLPAKFIKVILKSPLIQRYDTVIKKALYQLIDSPDYGESTGVKREIFKKVTSQDVSQFLSRIMVETLVVWGARDRHVPLSFGKRIVQEIPKARLEIVGGGKHGLHIQNPGNLWQIVKNFILT